MRVVLVLAFGLLIPAAASVGQTLGAKLPPVQHVSVKAWSDEDHVEKGRAVYRKNFDIADAILEGRYGYRRPQGAFFLWLNMADFGGGEAAATTLWKGCGVRVLPGTYLARDEPDGTNPARDYVRVALVHDRDTTREALTRIVATWVRGDGEQGQS